MTIWINLWPFALYVIRHQEKSVNPVSEKVTICLSQSGTVATQPPQETKVPGFEPHQ
jgi:hypothetical protein